MRVAPWGITSARCEGSQREMKKPTIRANLPPRNSDNMKRRLDISILAVEARARYGTAIYKGSSKHEQNPHIFGLEPFRGRRGDRTLCDRHASFLPPDLKRVGALLERALRPPLVGSHLWTVDDNGWIYELAVTNSTTNEHHGYPLRPSEAIAEVIFRHFYKWAFESGSDSDKAA